MIFQGKWAGQDLNSNAKLLLITVIHAFVAYVFLIFLIFLGYMVHLSFLKLPQVSKKKTFQCIY